MECIACSLMTLKAFMFIANTKHLQFLAILHPTLVTLYGLTETGPLTGISITVCMDLHFVNFNVIHMYILTFIHPPDKGLN